MGGYGPPDDPDAVPAGVGLAMGCESVTLEKTGRYRYQCEAGYVDTGEWTFADGLLFYRATREVIMCPVDDCPDRKVNDFGVRRIRVVGGFWCFDLVDGAPPWPGGRDLGKRVEADDGGGFPTGCFSH